LEYDGYWAGSGFFEVSGIDEEVEDVEVGVYEFAFDDVAAVDHAFELEARQHLTNVLAF
jgi:hypothetical protein